MPNRYEPLAVQPRKGDVLEHPVHRKQATVRSVRITLPVERRAVLAGKPATIHILRKDGFGYRILKRRRPAKSRRRKGAK